MPTISMFYGIIIRMYFAPQEHNPPHIHVYFQDMRATYSIQSAELLNGGMATRQNRLVQAWIELHREELMANWELCRNGDSPFRIEPLK